VRAMVAGLMPALNDARIRFALPSGISSISPIFLSRDAAGWPFDDFVVAVLFLGACLRRLNSTITAWSSIRSWASSRYLSDPERSFGRVTRAGDCASVDDADAARDDGFGTVDEARFRRS